MFLKSYFKLADPKIVKHIKRIYLPLYLIEIGLACYHWFIAGNLSLTLWSLAWATFMIMAYCIVIDIEENYKWRREWMKREAEKEFQNFLKCQGAWLKGFKQGTAERMLTITGRTN